MLSRASCPDGRRAYLRLVSSMACWSLAAKRGHGQAWIAGDGLQIPPVANSQACFLVFGAKGILSTTKPCDNRELPGRTPVLALWDRAPNLNCHANTQS
jgi:hypothetical protein